MNLWRRFLNLFRRAPRECQGCSEPMYPWRRTVKLSGRGVYRYTERNRCEECSADYPPTLPYGMLPLRSERGATLILLHPDDAEPIKPVMPPNLDVR